MKHVGRLLGGGMAPAAKTPPVTSNLAFWLDATDSSTITLSSGSKVSAWTDKSGNAFNWAQSNATIRPVYDPTLFSGKGGVIFDFTTGGGLLSNAAASTITQNNFTYFLVGKRTDGVLSAILQDFGSGQTYGPCAYNNRWGIGQAGVLALGGVPKNVNYVFGLKCTGTTATSFFFDAGATKQNLILNNGSLPHGATTIGNFSFGGKDFGASQGWSMQCAAVLMYNTTLSDSNIASICSWIRKKYKVSIPSSRAKNIVISGDSISAGVGSDGGTGFAELAMETLSVAGDQWVSSAIPGQLISNISSTDATNVDPLYNAGTKNVIAFMGGTNDIGNGRTDVQTLSAIASYYSARKAVGWNVGVATLLPSTITGFNTVRNSVNTTLKATAAGTYFDFLIDIASDATMGPDAAASNTTYYIDGTHPTPAGHALLAPIYATAINAQL